MKYQVGEIVKVNSIMISHSEQQVNSVGIILAEYKEYNTYLILIAGREKTLYIKDHRIEKLK